MSTVLRPRGPLPPRVYWTRRLLLLIVLVVLASLVWWFVGGSGQADEPSAGSGTTTGSDAGPATTQTQTTPPTDAAGAPHKPRSGRHGQAQGGGTDPGQQTGRQHPHRKAKPTSTPLAAPTGPCAPSDVGISIDVPDAAPGQPVTATLLFTSTKTPACTLAITPDRLALRVTSGADVVWTSDDCPDAVPAKEVVARTDPPTAYQFRWNGRRSSEHCQPVSSAPDPGGYWVEAALIGGDPHKAYFDIK